MINETAALQELIDEREIRSLYHRYCDIIDAMDYERLVEVYTPDCTRFYVDVTGDDEVRDAAPDGSPAHGVAPLIARLKKSLWHRTQHHVLNFRIDVDGDVAHARVSYYAVHQVVEDGPVMSLWGEYDDRLSRTEHGWRVATRHYTTRLREGDWENRQYRD